MSTPLSILLLGCLALWPQSRAHAQPLPTVDTTLPDAPAPSVAAAGTISGTVVDPNGRLLVSAHVALARPSLLQTQEVLSDSEGQFLLLGVAPGPFQLTIAAPGFAARQLSGILQAGEALVIPQIELTIAVATAEVRIEITRYQLAEDQVKAEEHQRVLGIIPNYFVSYQPNTLPLAPRQKFELAWKTALDPVTFAAAGGIAGIEQSRNDYRGYGRGTHGYFNRYGASYGDAFIGIMIGSAVLPSLFHQDPRYYYKGTGSTQARLLYALANAVICRGDNGHGQLNYSGILGSLASGGISNLYYPASW